MHFFLGDILITNIAHVVRDAHIPQVIIQISISKEGLALPLFKRKQLKLIDDYQLQQYWSNWYDKMYSLPKLYQPIVGGTYTSSFLRQRYPLDTVHCDLFDILREYLEYLLSWLLLD